MPKIEYFPETRSAILPLKLKLGRLLALHAAVDGFNLKDEHHLTVLSALPPDQIVPEENEKLQQVLDGQEIDDVILQRDAMFHVSKPKIVGKEEYPRESIIALAASKRLNHLLARRSLYRVGLRVPRQFPHVTLFTRGDNPYARRGIGIDSLEDFIAMDPRAYPNRP